MTVFPSLHEQALSKILQALFTHARSAEPVKLGPLDELVVEVSAAHLPLHTTTGRCVWCRERRLLDYWCVRRALTWRPCGSS